MTAIYIDTSAAMKLLVTEAESDALEEYLESSQNIELVASWLLHTELHCAAGRSPRQILTSQIALVLSAVALIDVSRCDLLPAGTQAHLRTLDAIHLAAAMRLGVTSVLTYDLELTRAAEAAGIEVIVPS